jgi:hypothetical protein
VDNTMTGTAGSMDGGNMPSVDQVKQQTQQAAGEMMEQARTRVTSEVSNVTNRAAEGLGTLAQSLRQAGDQLRSQDGDFIGPCAASAADMVDRFSTYLRDTEPRDMMCDVESFARRQPGLFLGGAFLIGFAAARFLKSSGSGMQVSTPQYGTSTYRTLETTAGMQNPHPANILSPEGQSESAGSGRYLRTSYERAQDNFSTGGASGMETGSVYGSGASAGVGMTSGAGSTDAAMLSDDDETEIDDTASVSQWARQ